MFIQMVGFYWEGHKFITFLYLILVVLNTSNMSYSAGACHVIQIPSMYPSDVGLERHALENIQPCLLSIIMVAGVAVVFGINSKVM